METYYTRQDTMPHFSGQTRQRGSGIGSLALGVGRVALPFAKKVLLPAVKSIGKELFVQSLQELMEVATNKKSLKKAAKSTLRKTAKKQFGAGTRQRSRKTRKRNSRQKRKLKRSRSDFFSRVKNVT